MSAPRVAELLKAPWRARLSLPGPAADPSDAGPAAAPCPGCRRPIAEQYCGACGEPKTAGDLSLGSLVAAGVEHLTSLDVRLLRTLRALVTRPGFLTVEWRRGVRARYTRPMQLFLLVTGIFFAAAPSLGAGYNTTAVLGYGAAAGPGAAPDRRPMPAVHVEALHERAEALRARTGESPQAFVERLDRKTDDVERALIVLFVPALTLLLAVLHAGRRRFLVEHAVFATHLFTFLLVYVVLVLGAARAATVLASAVGKARLALADRPPAAAHVGPAGNAVVATIVAIVLLIALAYLYVALRRAYGSRWWSAALRAAVIASCLLAGLTAYQRALFDVAIRLM